MNIANVISAGLMPAVILFVIVYGVVKRVPMLMFCPCL